MKIPIITSDSELVGRVERIMARSNESARHRRRAGDDTPLEAQPIGNHERAIDAFNYQMPPLVMINFSDPCVDGFRIVEEISADPWMNHGGIIAFYEGSATYDALSELQQTNVIISLSDEHVEPLLPNVLRIIKSNKQILFQRAIQTDLLSSVTGQFILGMDLLLVPCYANLVSNYLCNMGFVSPESKTGVALVLTEMLVNAIEHGNAGIGSEDKAAWLERSEDLAALIRLRCQDPAVARRKVYFSYEIGRERSTYVIRDEGKGFDWRSYLGKRRKMDFLAEHGRGILLAQQTADTIAYNACGNEVTLTFQHRPYGANLVPEALRNNEMLECRPEDVVFREGEESSFLYYVADGVFRVELGGKHVATITPEDILLGEMSFLLEERRSATVIATTPGKLIRISKESFINIIKHQPYYGLFLSRLLAQRLLRASRGGLS